MPAKIDCIVCRGTGIYYMDDWDKNPGPCRYCKGTGQVPQPKYRFHVWAEKLDKTAAED